MKIKELIKGKVTNITTDTFDDEIFEEEQKEVVDLFIGEDYVFCVYEGNLYDNILDNLLVIVGHENTLIYNKETKQYKDISTR